MTENQNLPWIEKYRPATADGIKQQYEIVAALKSCIGQNNLPNLLFHGPPGTGKTSLMLAAAKEMLKDDYSKRVLELNASDERGISVVRDKIKNFSKFVAEGHTASGARCPPFKLIVLDEVDNMTPLAQSALRRIMETECANTRFCLICNYLSRIIAPILSRCSKFRFKPLQTSVIGDFLREILAKESCEGLLSEAQLGALVTESAGDMRRAVNMLQNLIAVIRNSGDQMQTIDVASFLGATPDEIIDEFVKICVANQRRKIDAFHSKCASFGICTENLLEKAIQKLLEINSDQMSDAKKAKALRFLSEGEFVITNGGDHNIVLRNVLWNICAN